MTLLVTKTLSLIDNSNVVLSFDNTTYYSLRVQAKFASFPSVNIDTRLTLNSDRQNFQTAKTIDLCLMYLNLPLPQIYSLYFIGLIS